MKPEASAVSGGIRPPRFGRAKVGGESRPEVYHRRFWSRVDKTDTCWNWTAGKRSGYGQFWDGERDELAHRISYREHIGPIPAGMFVDHRCRNRACVNPEHLRLATNKQNMENRLATSRSKSGVRGVYWDGYAWVAQVGHNGNAHHFYGRYKTLDEAAEAVRLSRLEIFTHNEVDIA
jgi:hypothetical protein